MDAFSTSFLVTTSSAIWTAELMESSTTLLLTSSGATALSAAAEPESSSDPAGAVAGADHGAGVQGQERALAAPGDPRWPPRGHTQH